MADNDLTQNNTETEENTAENTADNKEIVEETEKPQEEEKLLRQTEVNEIVGREKHAAYEKAKRDLLNAQLNTSQQYAQPSNIDSSNLSDDKLRTLINEEADRRSQLALANQVATEFMQKMNTAKSKYPDFDSTVAELNLPTIPLIVELANSMDNTADIMYDIAKNPSKFANLIMLSQTAPQMAQKEIARLSKSIKANETAKNQEAKIAEPLSQIKPTTTGTDNGSMSIRDLRKQSWLKD